MFSRKSHPTLVYHEIDFEVVTQKKQRITQGNPTLARILPNITPSEEGSTWSSQLANGSEYHCHGIDLRSFAKPTDGAFFRGMRHDVPTLLISECCLCYLTVTEADSLMLKFTTRIPSLGFIIYEPIRPNDPFGKVMTSNLAARGIHMPTLEKWPEPSDQERRLKAVHVDNAKALTVGEIWRKWVGLEEKERVDSLEGLDEVEEWELLAAHYVVVWGSKTDSRGFGEWERRKML